MGKDRRDGHEYGMAIIKELPVGDCFFSLCRLIPGLIHWEIRMMRKRGMKNGILY